MTLYLNFMGNAMSMLTSKKIDEYWNKPICFRKSMHMLCDFVDGVLVLWISGDPTEIAKLKLYGCHLGCGTVRTPFRSVTLPGFQIYVGEWNPRRCVKGSQ